MNNLFVSILILASGGNAGHSALPLQPIDSVVVSQATFDSLRMEIAALKNAIGEFHKRPDVSKPCDQLPSGECPVFYRLRQIGLAIDYDVASVREFRTRLDNLPAANG